MSYAWKIRCRNCGFQGVAKSAKTRHEIPSWCTFDPVRSGWAGLPGAVSWQAVPSADSGWEAAGLAEAGRFAILRMSSVARPRLHATLRSAFAGDSTPSSTCIMQVLARKRTAASLRSAAVGTSKVNRRRGQAPPGVELSFLRLRLRKESPTGRTGRRVLWRLEAGTHPRGQYEPGLRHCVLTACLSVEVYHCK